MKFEIGQKVIALDKKCIIVATKETPYESQNNALMKKKKMFPEKEYLLFQLKEINKDGIEIYLGILDLYESQIEEKEW